MSGAPNEIKVLGLHGKGTSAQIFKSQTAAFRHRLPEQFNFTFIDAPHICDPAPATDILFTSNHYGWYHMPATPEVLRSAHAILDAYLAEHGPFDIVMGFSQGCAVISSYILYHQREKPGVELPFKGAVFICGSVPLPALRDLGVNVTKRTEEVHQTSIEQLGKRTTELLKLAQNLKNVGPGAGTKVWDDKTGLVHDPEEKLRTSDVYGLDFTKMAEDLLVQIPTVHIYGAKDPRWPCNRHLEYFCMKKKVFDHGGGHEIPRFTAVSDKIAEMVVWLANEIKSG
ncbi:serine hydrolase FSH [Dichotomopilus funicola]|uniref:Serine hydrolase FSH n=1 Tax=Dichotomopilus funicola TaxID=1934379 RepID=A0AAN6ZKG2_9PEZI|nr:serine hydrolase FSH [Dichotomopilus funicola]